jgi:predicted metal-binding protein
MISWQPRPFPGYKLPYCDGVFYAELHSHTTRPANKVKITAGQSAYGLWPMPFDDFEQHLKSIAQELGLQTRRMSAFDVRVEDWIRLKCQYGCPNYGRRFTCPPYSPEPPAMRAILEAYSTAFLLRFDAPAKPQEADMAVQQDGMELAIDAFLRLERFAFLNGYPKAFVFGLNYCPGCHVCTVEEGVGACKRPQMARPSLESCGIDVRRLLESAGWEEDVRGIDILKREDHVSLISLLLLE